MAAQAMQLLAIHYGYHSTLQHWTYPNGPSDHIHLSILTEDIDIEIPKGYLFSEQSQIYLEESKLWLHHFQFNY